VCERERERERGRGDLKFFILRFSYIYLGAIRGLSAIGDVAIDFVLPVLRQIFLDYSDQTPTQIGNSHYHNTPSQTLEQRSSRPLIEVINPKEQFNEKPQKQRTDKSTNINTNTNTNKNSNNNKKKESDDSLPKKLQVRLEVGEALLQVLLSSTLRKTLKFFYSFCCR
jgi:hypothetical protein